MKRGWGKKQINIPPHGKARTSQVVTTYGPGAMVDLIDSAVLIGGLEFWQYAGGKGTAVIQEPRLRDAVAERLARANRELAIDDAFREPPAGDDKQPTRFRGIQVLEFPQWFVCQSCRALTRSRELDLKSNRYRHPCSRGREGECVPVRFVAACPRGHLEDFPWVSFAHRSWPAGRCPSPSLTLREGATGDFSEIVVECVCGAHEKLSTAQAWQSNPRCGGKRPWLGPDSDEPDCEELLRLLVRTASNSYFTQVMSALSIPEHGRELEDAVKQHWATLKNADAESLPYARKLNDAARAALAPYDDSAVLAVIDAVRSGQPMPRPPIRTAEYQQLMAQRPESGELPGAREAFFARACTPAGGGKLPGVARVVLAHKLREVRVQVGFTRLEPVTADLQGEYDLEVRSAPLSQAARWLPASEIRGEGILIALDEAALRAWEERPAVAARTKELAAGFAAWAEQFSRDSRPDFPGGRFYLLHSLSHLLLSAISLECGYAASALRERIYCAPATDPVPMAAILIATGTPGAEGTLGGLVEQGRKLRSHLRRAYDLGVLCSHDPVCGAHSPEADHAERYLEGAACHGCLFIAECSCERFNRYLDRALVVPTMGHPDDLAFFPERP